MAVGAEAIVAAELGGMVLVGAVVAVCEVAAASEVTGGIAGVSTATELADGGAVAAESVCGVATVDGNTGSEGGATSAPAVRAASDVSVAGASFFHQAKRCGICAQRGPD